MSDLGDEFESNWEEDSLEEAFDSYHSSFAVDEAPYFWSLPGVRALYDDELDIAAKLFDGDVRLFVRGQNRPLSVAGGQVKFFRSRGRLDEDNWLLSGLEMNRNWLVANVLTSYLNKDVTSIRQLTGVCRLEIDRVARLLLAAFFESELSRSEIENANLAAIFRGLAVADSSTKVGFIPEITKQILDTHPLSNSQVFGGYGTQSGEADFLVTNVAGALNIGRLEAAITILEMGLNSRR